MLLTCIRAHCTIHLNESYMDMTISEKLLRIKSLLIITLKIEWYLHGTDVWYEQRKLILTIFFGWTKEPINTLKMERFQFERRSEIEEAKELVTLQAIDWIKMKFVEQRACCWQLHSLRKKKIAPKIMQFSWKFITKMTKSSHKSNYWLTITLIFSL